VKKSQAGINAPAFTLMTVHPWWVYETFGLICFDLSSLDAYLIEAIWFHYFYSSTLCQDTARQNATVDHADMRGLVTTGLHCVAELAFL
jgi:hypothetical protein